MGSRSRVMTTEQMEALQAFAAKKVVDLGNEIADGNIAIAPTTYKSREACTFCKFKEICAFDPGLPGFKKHECKSMNQEESWSLIRTELQKES